MSASAITEKILSQLQSSQYWGDATKRGEKYVDGLICPECGKQESYTYTDRPYKLYCSRRNNCGAVVDLSEILPESRIDFEVDFAATAEDQKRPATAYLENRGLKKSLEGLAYEYWPNVRNSGCGAVMFPITSPSDEKVYNGRLFAPPDGEGKTHNKGSTAGCVWRHPGITYDSGRETFVTEGIINALSLIEVGHQAVAVLSCGQDPAKVNLSGLGKIVLAFDNDPAGHKALRRYSHYFAGLKDGEKIKIKSMLPIKGDWNDLLLSGALEAPRFESSRSEYVTEAALACAGSAQQYAQIWFNQRGRTGLFHFDREYFYSTVKVSGQSQEVVCQRVSDFTLRTRYYQLDRTNPAEPVYRYNLEIRPKSGRPSDFTVSAQELSYPQGLRTMFLQRGRVSWTGEKAASNALVEQILRTNAPIVRQVDITGYDVESKCYIFKHHMIVQQGHLVWPDKNGFFRVNAGEYAHPPYHNAFRPSANSDVRYMVDQLYKAWGLKAIATFAWVVASWFVNQIKEQVGWFPFFSLYGDTQTGKSNLTIIMNRFQCQDGEGIPMNKTNTAKGEIRKMAQRSGCFTALLEWPHDGKPVRFDLDTILTLFNVNPLQVRAVKTNDLRTHETPFLGALMFVQNIEPFKTKAQRERVVSLEFKTEELNDTTREAFDALDRTPAADKAGIYPQVMQHRLFFEQQWHHYYESAKRDLEDLNLTSRILETHGMVLGFYRMLSEVLRIDYDILPYMQTVAMKKQAMCSERQVTAADEFFDIIQNLDQNAVSGFMEVKDGIMWIRKPDAEKYLREQNYLSNWHNSVLTESLRDHPALVYFNHARRFNGSTRKMWGFEVTKIDMGQG